MSAIALPSALRATALALPFVGACVPSMRSSFRDGRELAEQTFDAAGLTGIDLDAEVGDVELHGAAADSVQVQVTLRSSDAERLARECLPKSSLDVRRDGAVLTVRLEQRTRDRCGTRWRIAMSPRLHARVRARVGDVTVTGLASGIDVATGNGDIDVRSRATSHGRVEVRSDVGRVAVRVHGYAVPAERPQGAGQRATLRGPGGPDLVLHTRIGRASLVIDGGGA
ncbi:MAG: hypothetical protein ACXW61_01965 [Gemmatirosa sp.]